MFGRHIAKRVTSLLFVLLLVAPSQGTIAQAGTNVRPRPKPQQCLNLASKIGSSKVWWGRHIGSREVETSMFSDRTKKETINKIGCFKTRQDCENWLYWMRTDYPDSNYYKPCRRGL